MPAGLSSGPRVGYDLSRVGAGLGRGPNLRKKLTAAAWSGTWPAPGATLDLDFANDRGFVRGLGQGSSMDAVTFTRASAGTYVDSAGLVQTATNNVRRLDWAATDRTGAGTAASPYVIPLAASPTCNGLLIEESRANRILWCRDATQANWTCTNVTPLKDQTGIDGVSNAASSLTASADGGTCIQTITLASGSRTGSVYLKRITGTGNVQVSLDGTTWSTVDLSNGIWNRIVISGTVTNPTVGIKLATNGDAVALDFAQIEDGAFATTPVLTTTASATRAVDAASISGANLSWYTQGRGTFVCTYRDTPSQNVYFGISDGSVVNFLRVWKQSSTSVRFDVQAAGNASFNGSTNSIPNASGFNTVAAAFTNYNIALSLQNLGVQYEAAIRPRTVPANFTICRIGADYNGSGTTTTAIKRLIYFPSRLADAALIALAGGAT